MNGIRFIIAMGAVVTSLHAWAEPKAVSVTAEQAAQLTQIGTAMGLQGYQTYKTLDAMSKEYPEGDFEAMPDAGQLISQNILNLGVTFSVKEFVVDANNKFIRGTELPLNGPNLPTKANHNLALTGKFLAYVKRPIEQVAKAFIPLEGGAMAPGWLSAETFPTKTDSSVVPYTTFRYDVVKGGHFTTFCQNSAHIIQWSVDHVEIQQVDNDCREVNAQTVAQARSEVKAGAASGKPNFLWVNQGRQVIDLIRISGDITAISLRNISQLYTHKAMLGIDVGLNKVLPNAEKSFREGMVAHFKRMGLSAKSNEF